MASETKKLTVKLLASLKPGPEHKIWDEETTGLYVRVRPRAVAYFVQTRNPQGKDVGRKLWEIGAVVEDGEAETETVRRHAREIINLIKRGIDPTPYIEEASLGGTVIRAKQGTGWTLRQLLAAFVETKRDRRRGYLEYRSALLTLPELWAPDPDDPTAEAPTLSHLGAEDQARLRALPMTAATAITREDIQLVRDSVTARVSPRRSKAVLDYVSGAYRWAQGEPVSGIPEDCNPTLNVRRGQTRRQKLQAASIKEPLRWLTLEEVRHLLLAIDSTPCDPSIRNALILDLLSAQRKGSLITAPVSAFKYDEEHGHYLALDQTKVGDRHSVPLAPVALAFVRQQLEMARRRESPWLFPTARTYIQGKTLSGHISDNAINTYLERMLNPPPPIERPTGKGRGVQQYTDEEWAEHVERHHEQYGYLHRAGVPWFKPHDFRRTITANLTSRGLCPEWYTSVLLDHELGVGNSERRSEVTAKYYNPYEYWREKRIAAEAWAELLVVNCALSEALYPLPPETGEEVEVETNRRYTRRQGRQA